MCVNNLPKVAAQWNSGATRDSNRSCWVLIPSALTTTPPRHTAVVVVVVVVVVFVVVVLYAVHCRCCQWTLICRV